MNVSKVLTQSFYTLGVNGVDGVLMCSRGTCAKGDLCVFVCVRMHAYLCIHKVRGQRPQNAGI